MRRLIFILLLIPLLGVAQWREDILGDGYEMRYVDQGRDYSGPVRSTIIRKRSDCGKRKGILYVHGYNDYFFQKEMGDRFVDSCYNFYAVDLRKYGRSIMPGQRKFEVRNLNEYFADIDSALVQMHRDGVEEVVLMGHSTGGLITSLYMKGNPDSSIRALVLNSPFLEWNLNGFMRNILIPTVGTIGRLFPKIDFSNGDSTAYGESLLKGYHGEWDYNTDWKTLHPEKVTSGWLRAIDEGHAALRRGKGIEVPILLMHSDKSVEGESWTPEFQRGDAVLNVDDISRYGRKLGKQVTEATVKDGLHDLILSRKGVREAVYRTIFDWIGRE